MPTRRGDDGMSLKAGAVVEPALDRCTGWLFWHSLLTVMPNTIYLTL
jgi:hypothetical protein